MEKCSAACRHDEKTGWPKGPWTKEPDRVEFRHEGLPCLLHRGPIGAWCGYVGVPPGHPLYGKRYDDAPVDVHGGLTYSKVCAGPICHVPEPGEPDDVWWFGFDCGHYMDLAPAALAIELKLKLPKLKGIRETYRTLAYVRAETRRLAEQLAGAHGTTI